MLVGVISDVHANRVALEAVLDDMPSVDAIVNAGDVVGYNPWPAECVAEMREREIPTVQGNHDRMVVGSGNFRGNHMAAAGVEYAREQLTDGQRTWLAGLPTERTLFEGRLKVVHGHPDDPDHYTRPHEFGPRLLGDEDVLVMGHTHVQHHESYDAGVVLNPGSVGQPRDDDPRAAYALVDLTDLSVEARRVEYDVETVVAAVRDAGLPERTGTRLREGY
ncbi:MAG: metallophosphoesterase [Halobacteriaceae archaeon]